ncbi:MAG: FAD-dependent oxidoreductase [Candidatus Nanoarchaeia archaeon]|nr:FAD-dependent oxidoreductase [Candidatus Nanoarchaeia archaeon]
MVYDLVIIGQGPAGLSAGIYASRYKLKTLILSEEPGGTATHAYKIENYPGFNSISGMDLMRKFREQINDSVEIKQEKVIELKKDDLFIVTTDKGIYKSKTIIVAAGTKRRELNIPGEHEFLGKGVSYCATCDAMFFKDKRVAVVGGNDAAAMSAMLVSEYADEVFILYRKEKIRAEPKKVEMIENNKKIKIINNTNVIEIKGNNMVESLALDNKYNESNELNVDGVFIEIGSVPSTVLTNKTGVNLDENGYIVVDEGMKTNINGFYAAGDITTGSNKFWQIITAASEGAIAAKSAYDFLKNGNV